MADEPPVTEDAIATALREGHYADALSSLKALADTPSDDREGYVQLVPILKALAEGAPEEAYYRLAEELEAPTDLEPAVYASVGDALERKGSRELAASAWASAEDDALAEKSVAVRDDLGLDDEAFEKRVASLTVAYYRARVADNDQDASAWETIGRKLFTQELPMGALEAAEKAIAIDRTRVWAWVTAGQVLAMTGRTDDALRRLEDGARANPTRAEPLNEAGMIHLTRRNEAEALTCFRRALDRAPDDREAKAHVEELEQRRRPKGAPRMEPPLRAVQKATERTVVADKPAPAAPTPRSSRVLSALWWAFMLGVGVMYLWWSRHHT